MKTTYSIYGVYDADVQAFKPESLCCMLTDNQYLGSIVHGLKSADPDQVEQLLPSMRFYRLASVEIDVIPADAHELTGEVLNAYKAFMLSKSEVKE